MKSTSLPLRLVVLTIVVLAAALFRLLPAPVNFSPIAALALFAGFSFRNRLAAFVFPLIALLISDAIIGFHSLMWVVYACFAVITALGIFIQGQKGAAPKVAAALAGSALFFIVTNFAVWSQSGGMYPQTIEGLITCYIAALPFLDNSVAGDLVFTAVLFGGWALAEKQVPALRAHAA
jgi:hypothetical protein